MGTRRGLRRAGALAVVGALVAAVSCLDPTEVTLVLTTNVPCALDRGTMIVVGTAADVGSKAPLTITQDCTAAADAGVDHAGALTMPASIGTLVLTPSGSQSGSFIVRIVTAIDPTSTPMDCAPPYTNCVVASRELSFVPHTPITLPIELTLDCESIDCGQGQTCDLGRCVRDTTTVNCSGSACSATVQAGASVDAGSPADVGSSIPDAAVESGPGAPDASVDADAHVEGGSATDANPLGSCVDAGPSSVVACAGSTCSTAAGNVCCVTVPQGAAPSEACVPAASCNTAALGSTIHVAIACRDVGDCQAGLICCYQAGSGAGFNAVCTPAASCPFFSSRQGCRNTCECSTGNTCHALACWGEAIGVCGNGGASCP